MVGKTHFLLKLIFKYFNILFVNKVLSYISLHEYTYARTYVQLFDWKRLERFELNLYLRKMNGKRLTW